MQGYPNPLARFTGGVSGYGAGSGSSSRVELLPGTFGGVKTGQRSDVISGLGEEVSSGDAVPAAATVAAKESAGDSVSMAVRGRQTGGHRYTMSTLLFAGLIAFLMGSLLRSLLSPADFIYVVTDLGAAEEANSVGGWREIRRLLEIKYLVGGWDFQVAVVRRH